jgi:hypothetical protein
MDELSYHFSYVPKSSDMMFATLQAFGLAEFFRCVNQSKDDLEILIEDIGAAFRISVNITLQEMQNQIADNGLPNILPALIPADQIVPPEEGKKPRYDSVLSRYLPDNFRGRTVFYTRKRQTIEETPFTEYLPWDDPLFPVWDYICTFNNRAATQRAYPLCVHSWHAHTLDLSTALGLFSTVLQLYDGISDKNSVGKDWAKSVKPHTYRGFGQFWQNNTESQVTALSILSPSTVKGNQNPDARTGILEQAQKVFWLEFYFAFVGFLCVAMPFDVEDDGLVLACPHIQYLDYLNFRPFMESYRANKRYQSLLRKSKQYSLERTELLAGVQFFDSLEIYIADKKSSQISLDIAVSYYKHIGKAYSPFGGKLFLQKNVRGLGLNLNGLIRMIDSIPNVNRLLLSRLSNAIRNNESNNWLEFFCLYNPQQYAPKLHVKILSKILLQTDVGVPMNKKPTTYADMFENEGFKTIAEAINTCTERAAYLKSIDRDTNLKVWHNLDQRLLQHADDASRFIPDVAEFILDYQKEMSRVQGNNKHKDYMQIVSLDVLRDLYALIDKFGSAVVAYYLVAAGY